MLSADPAQPPFRAIGARLVRIVILLGCCCVIAAVALQALYGSRIVRADLDARLQEVRHSRVPRIGVAMLNAETQLIQSQLAEIAAIPHVSGVRLVTSGGQIYYAGRERNSEGTWSASLDIGPINAAGEPVGRLFLQTDQGAILRTVLVDSLSMAVIFGMVTSLLCFLLLRFLRREILAPLQRLLEHIIAMSPDKPVSFNAPYSASRAPRPWRDDLDMIGDRFASLHASVLRTTNQLHQAEQALVRERDRLEGRIAERTLKLELACDQAEQANRTKSEFLANMSHEIRTPINAIAGFTTLAMRTELSPRQADYLDKINGATRALQHIISDVLDFSKIEAGRLEIEHVPLVLHDVLDTAVTYVGAQAERKGLEMLIRVAPDVPAHCIGDPLRLGQILNNLCSNAVKFTDCGEIEICVSVASVPIPGNDRVRLLFSVRDTGIGLTPEQSGSLFKAFAQAESSTTRKFGGTGLGLVICKRLVGLMHGNIWMESQKGIGTTFFFEVEVTAMAAATLPALPTLPAELVGKPALVVDDNASARQILAAQLKELGMEPREVENGEAAIVELRKATREGHSYPVVFMDWRMPGLDGLTATRVIRNDTEIAGTPVIIMVTAYAREQVSEAAGDAHLLDNILLKPATTRMLAQTLCGTGAELMTSRVQAGSVREQRLIGIRLLLVEDNPVNQQLARELLEMEGALISIADNGRVALEMLAAQSADHFHAVLLDLQMPEMDGYETARRVRAMPEHAGLPLIAMTAHAMSKERDRCLSLGMNDHLAKPIDTELLVSKLVRWISTDIAVPVRIIPTKATNTQMPAPQDALPDTLPGIDLRSALDRCGGNSRLLQDLLAMFHANYNGTLEQMHQLCAEGRWIEAGNLAHTIRGAAANLAMDELASAAGGLELALRSNQIATMADAEQA
jgi:two-component system, sensor histidine kinase and response regulator